MDRGREAGREGEMEGGGKRGRGAGREDMRDTCETHTHTTHYTHT